MACRSPLILAAPSSLITTRERERKLWGLAIIISHLPFNPHRTQSSLITASKLIGKILSAKRTKLARQSRQSKINWTNQVIIIRRKKESLIIKDNDTVGGIFMSSRILQLPGNSLCVRHWMILPFSPLLSRLWLLFVSIIITKRERRKFLVTTTTAKKASEE